MNLNPISDFSIFKPYIKELIAYYYEMPEKGAGGLCHIVLDDGNFGFENINYCQYECEKAGDTFGVFLCDILTEFTDEELEEMYDNDWWGMH